MGNLERVLVVVILATVAVIAALAFLDSGAESGAPAVPGATPDSTASGPPSALAREHALSPAPAGTPPQGQAAHGGRDLPFEIPNLRLDTPRPDAGGKVRSADGAPPQRGPLPGGPLAGEPATPKEPQQTRDEAPSPKGVDNGPTIPPREARPPGDGPPPAPSKPRTPEDSGGGIPYRVRPGDTYRSIAKDVLGDAGLASAIQEANRDVLGPEPPPGSVLFVPRMGHVAPHPPGRGDSVPAGPGEGVRIHVVRKGETLSGIARQYLGTTRRWKEIFEANRDLIQAPERIRPGMKLRIPEKRVGVRQSVQAKH